MPKVAESNLERQIRLHAWIENRQRVSVPSLNTPPLVPQPE